MLRMAAFVDPRDDPKVCLDRPVAGLAADPTALTEFHRLCRDGRLYDVERWIQAGRPLQLARGTTVKGRRLTSALEIALETGNHALVSLLLCNGYDPNFETSSSLDLALRARRWDLLDVLLEWGADPHQVNLGDLFGTYNSQLYERFRALGVDLTAGHDLAEHLAYPPNNKPLLGFVKRHREHDPAMQTELNMALVHHADEGSEKGVQMCLWAGADPHAPAPSLRFSGDVDEEADEEDRFVGWTAIEQACNRGDLQVLRRLGPDPVHDDFDKLFEWARDRYVIEFLAKLALPKNVGSVIRSQFFWMQEQPFGLGYPRSVDTLRPLFEAGARWEASSPDEIASIRRLLLRMSDHTFVDAMKLLASNDFCSEAILCDLGRTNSMRERMKKVRFIPLPAGDPRRYTEPRPTRSREDLAKFGVAEKEEPRKTNGQRIAPAPPVGRSGLWPVEIGHRHLNGREIRLDRAALFERVWSEPVEKLAKEWGLSGRGLSKACHRLRIPVPPRGFWAKTRAGQRMRRPRLPQLEADEAQEIVIRAPG